ncbi:MULTISPECIES: FGGY-family carbohydrate kinase [unclassified Duganella]|uniref:FGGY-family carbohydrate kinase n=1 Tax=unclassified Duganella TaxID=2636909 RepID=UPI0008853A26|nr:MULTISPECIES: FGGY family carbohydrate kinase [unclassified Duganella]SDG82788.1 Sugar (pentulose or hexulose) kinase [Duganella sp. OV458]SDK10171.1 Sugar (pentulose or hexulose) kinase [Duganella sp. OV510]
MTATIVLDIGKTNVKLVLLDDTGAVVAERRMANAVVRGGPYPHYDTEHIWSWLLDGLQSYARLAYIGAIVPVTHGATAALVDQDGLVLPVLDYEYEPPAEQVAQYAASRPAYTDTRSPQLPAGLNLGRQLAWQAHAFPAEFQRARHILMYPQYWAWRLSGVAASEVTSLGCHTDLWQPARQQYSLLVEGMGWTALFPPLRPAWEALGDIKPELAQQTGLPADCRILCGIHDSNASLLRHLTADTPPAVLSTGTWVIAAAPGKQLDGLCEQADMLANTSALGQAVACMRFMGGREFSELAGADATPCTLEDLQALISQGTFALPSFAGATGPFAQRTGDIRGPAPRDSRQRYALATLYCVLMSDYCLTALGVDGEVVVEGSFTGNPWFAPLLAALRPQQQVSSTDDSSGTTCGGWLLHHWGRAPASQKQIASPLPLSGWQEYKQQWLKVLL